MAAIRSPKTSAADNDEIRNTAATPKRASPVHDKNCDHEITEADMPAISGNPSRIPELFAERKRKRNDNTKLNS